MASHAITRKLLASYIAADDGLWDGLAHRGGLMGAPRLGCFQEANIRLQH